MRIPVYLEVGAGGSTRAWTLVLPGVSAQGATPDAAVAAIPTAVQEEIAHLARSGTPWAHANEPLEFHESERVNVAVKLEEGAARALFKWDLRPTLPGDVAAFVARFDRACAEIEAHADPARLTAFSDQVEHLITRLGTKLPGKLPEDPRERMRAAADRAHMRLMNLLPGDLERHAVFDGQPWTTRKVLRRLAALAVDEARAAVASAASSATPAPPTP